MCPIYKNEQSQCKMKGYEFYEDGYCRIMGYRTPNQRVCPIGQVLCPDLSCRDKIDECLLSKEKLKTELRCVGQQLVSGLSSFNYDKCPRTVTCNNIDDVVCPGGFCVSSEKECQRKICDDEDKPYLCQNNECAKNFTLCPQDKTCTHPNSLCEDGECRQKCEE